MSYQPDRSKAIFALVILFSLLSLLLLTSCETSKPIDGQEFISQNPSSGKAEKYPRYEVVQCPHLWVTDKTTAKTICSRCSAEEK